MGLHSTIFGPVKFAYLPQVLRPDEIVGGNGLVEMGTFVAILLGTMLAGTLVDLGPTGVHYAAVSCVVLAVLGVVAAWQIPAAPAADASLALDFNPWRVTWANLKVAREERAVFLSLLGISWLWFFGAVFLTQFPPLARDVLGGGPTVANLLLAVFTVGVAVGALGCEKLSRHQVEIGLVPFGSLGMTLFTVDLYFATRGLAGGRDMHIAQFLGVTAHWRVLADLLLLAVFTGFYSVPLYSLIQTRGAPTHRARIIAANNILNALFLILAAGFGAVALGVLGWTIPQLFLATALLNLLVAVYIYSLVPEFLLRLLSWLLVSVVYRIRRTGVENIPARGGAVIVSNHVSFVDALVLMAMSPRPVRFVMDLGIFRVPVLSWLFRQVKAIPITSAKDDPRIVEAAFTQVSQALRDGELVCIFPEGRLSADGEIASFRPGISRILAQNPVPVIPVALQGLWGSFFSRRDAPAMTRPFRRGMFSRIGIHAGPAIAPAVAAPEHLRARVAELRGAWR
jgi:1-acyl-sn-glycerol-3-phosphate acyltransferase